MSTSKISQLCGFRSIIISFFASGPFVYLCITSMPCCQSKRVFVKCNYVYQQSYIFIEEVDSLFVSRYIKQDIESDGMNESFNHPSVSDCALQYFLISFDKGPFSWNSCYLLALSSRKLHELTQNSQSIN